MTGSAHRKQARNIVCQDGGYDLCFLCPEDMDVDHRVKPQVISGGEIGIIVSLLLFLIAASSYAAPPPKNLRVAQSAFQGASQQEIDAAIGMEMILMEQMLSEMRKTVPENDLVPVSQSERIYRQMLDQEYARQMTNSHPLGIAELVLAELRGKR